MTPLARHVFVVLPVLLALCPAGVSADGYAPAESAAVARAEWAEMRKARAAGDRAAAVAHAARAHAAWPGQWVYAYGLASVAAAAGDAAAVRGALDDLADLGAGPDLSPDTTLVAFARSPAGVEGGAAHSLDRVDALRMGGIRGNLVFELPASDSTFWPEGIAYDSLRAEFYLAGVRDGRVLATDRKGRTRPFARVAPRGWSALAVAVDLPRDLVWVTAAAIPQAASYDVADSGKAAIMAFDRSTGGLRFRFDLPAAAEGHIPGDILVAPDGEVYVSDSAQPVIYRVRAGTLERFATDAGFRSLQGQGLSMDGRTLYVADHSHGIAAIDRRTAAVRWLPTEARGSTLGIDGLMVFGTRLFGVQNGLTPARVVSLGLAGEGEEARINEVLELGRDPVRADEPTMLARAGDRLVYVANSQWEKHDEQGGRRPGTRLESPRILEVPRLRVVFGPVKERSPGDVIFECGTP